MILPGQNSQVQALGPLVNFTPASVLQEDPTQVASAVPESPIISSLAGYIQTCWSKAKQAKLLPEQQMMRNLRQRSGVYESDRLAAIKQMGGSEVYVLLTNTKCRSAEAWINDTLRPVGERPWAINPTPIADIPPDLQNQIRQETEAIFAEVLQQAQTLGQFIPQGELQEEIREYAESRRDEILKSIQEEAELRTERMSMVIDDQLQEGGWHNAFWGVIGDLVTLKAGVLKGPVIERKKVKRWAQGQGGWTLETQEELVPTFKRVSPFDLYPAPDSRHPDDGFLIERHLLTRSELQAFIGVPGYSDENIRKVLSDFRTGTHQLLSIDSERAQIEFSGNTGHLTTGEKIEALEFWGAVQGKLLGEWGIPGLDPDLDYEVNAWLIGTYVIRAILNPDKLGKKPYSVDSYERIPGSFWGKGVPELMADVQDVCNAVARAIVNNTSLASGPQVEVNIDRCNSDAEEIWPWKIWSTTNQQMSEAPAVRFNQPACITQPLLQTFEFFSALSEDQTGIPRWAYANTAMAGAGETASGLSMLMTQASRGIKEVIAHVDRMVSGCIERLYDYNMLYHPDPDIKGDAQVVARGAEALLAKEQRAVRTNEFLAATNNPIDSQIMGLEGRARLLKEAAKALDLMVDDIVPDKDGLKELVARIQEQQAQMIAMGQNPGLPPGMVPPMTPRQLDMAGNPQGGTDVNQFKNQKGVSPG